MEQVLRNWQNWLVESGTLFCVCPIRNLSLSTVTFCAITTDMAFTQVFSCQILVSKKESRCQPRVVHALPSLNLTVLNGG